MRRAAKVDANQAAIVSALRSAGASVWFIGLPVDLLVGFQGRTMLMEIKTLLGKRDPKPSPYTPLQIAFLAEWRGGTVSTITDVEGALHALRVLGS
jgi:hypothetical protein